MANKYIASYVITLGFDHEITADSNKDAARIARDLMSDDDFTDMLLDYFATYDGTDLWHAVRDCDICLTEED